MTVLVAAVFTALSLGFAAFLSELGELAVLRARAQTAADAAALAAAAEAAPYGSGRPEQSARALAVRNGARLIGCDCHPGTRAAEVTVELHGVPASARAEIDATGAGGARSPRAAHAAGAGGARSPRAGGLDPRMARAVERLLAASGGRVWVTSGARTPAEQRALWAAALERYGDPEVADDWVARPGTSAHERGVAVDLGGDLDEAVRLVDQLGLPLHRPMSWEPWHFELSS